MSLPKEWNLQASEVCLDKPERPHSLISDELEIAPKYENKFLHAVYHPSIPDHCRAPLNAALLAECDNSGSLFSIQSAPVGGIVDGGGVLGVGGGLGANGTLLTAGGAGHAPDAFLDRQQRDSYPGTGVLSSTLICTPLHSTGQAAGSAAGLKDNSSTLLRPSSLAFDLCFQPSKPHGIEPQLSAELDEDDNENLLTVSSLTARPLIAKSREIRSKREKQQLKRKQRVTTEPSSRDEEEEGPPDGGYGWVIVFGAFSVQFWVAGLVKSYGVLFVEIMENFPDSSATTASWIPAILSALCLALAPVSSALCQRFSCRAVVITGGVFCSLGLALSYFATSLVHLLFTFGVLTGIGGGLSTTPGIVIVSQYFEKRRALANGITISGTAAGSFIFPTLIERLVHAFGFHGTLLILGGCMLHVCVSGALYRPVEDSAQKKPAQSRDSRLDFKENLGHLSSSEDQLSRRCLEDLFLDDAIRGKNRANTIDSKLVNVMDKTLQESEDELKDIISNAIFLKPIASIKSCSILHSVEDLSTDSTFVYRNRGSAGGSSGYDSHRGSRINRNRFHPQQSSLKDSSAPTRPAKTEAAEQPLVPAAPPSGGLGLLGLKIGGGDFGSTGTINNNNNNTGNGNGNNLSTLSHNNNRGLSKSMIIPTPVSNILDEEFEEYGNGILAKISQYLDISLLQDATFILMCLSVGLMSVGCPYMLYYLPAYAISAGNTKSEAGYLVAVSAALDLIGRLTLGWLSDLDLFDRKKAYVVCILGAGTAVLTIASTDAWIVIAVSAGCYGLCLGSWYLLVPVLLADLFGTDRISSSYGLVRMFQSIGAISVPPLAGLLRDLSGGYEICFYCMGVCMVLGSVPLVVVIIKDTLAVRDERKLTSSMERVA
uniref:Putative monocarboxylate transporter n=2 Tax=Culex tarsalis TaxID=7177 RepID=A0A1Q3FJN0_CULTA